MPASSPTDPSFYPLGKPPTLPSGVTVPLSPGYRAGDLLYTSGQLAFNANGSLDPTADTKEQTLQCLANACAVLAEAGVDRNQIFKASVWLTANADFGRFNAGWAEFFGDHYPARSTVRSELMLPGALVEIEVIAYTGTSK